MTALQASIAAGAAPGTSPAASSWHAQLQQLGYVGVKEHPMWPKWEDIPFLCSSRLDCATAVP